MIFECYKCKRDITAEVKKAKDATPDIVVHFKAALIDPDSPPSNQDIVVTCPNCQFQNVFTDE